MSVRTLTSPRDRGVRSTVPPLQTLALFESFTDEECRALEQMLPAIRWPAGTAPPEGLDEPDHLYVVRAGMLAWRCPTPSGGDVVVGLLTPGDVFSSIGTSAPCRMRPVEETRICPISGPRLQRLMTRVPRLGMGLVTALTSQLDEAARGAGALSEVRVEDRLLGVFALLAARHGRVTSEGIRLPMLFTHSQWAELVGASREAVTAALLRLRRRGTLICRGRTVILPPELTAQLLTASGEGDRQLGASGEAAA